MNTVASMDDPYYHINMPQDTPPHTDEYDRGFTAGAAHTHELLSQYISWLKSSRAVIEEEGAHRHGVMNQVQTIQKQINALEYAKLVVRKGYWDDECELPW